MRRLWDNGPALLALCMLIWAGSVVTGRRRRGQVPPALFTAVRWCGALVLALPFRLDASAAGLGGAAGAVVGGGGTRVPRGRAV